MTRPGTAAMTRWLAISFVAASLLAAAPADAACMKAEEAASAEGRLATGRFQDAAGRPESAFILRLAAPTCLEGSEDTDKVARTTTIHVFSPKDAIRKRISQLVGKQVRVTGTPFGAHTAHHHAPIVMDVTEIAAR